MPPPFRRLLCGKFLVASCCCNCCAGDAACCHSRPVVYVAIINSNLARNKFSVLSANTVNNEQIFYHYLPWNTELWKNQNCYRLKRLRFKGQKQLLLQQCHWYFAANMEVVDWSSNGGGNQQTAHTGCARDIFIIYDSINYRNS